VECLSFRAIADHKISRFNKGPSQILIAIFAVIEKGSGKNRKIY
jgi:hypothetical protein